jgi:tetratricopeptide (TPR) repeat protein
LKRKRAGSENGLTGSVGLSLENVRRGMCCAAVLIALLAVSACSTAPKKDSAAAKAAAQQQLTDNMAAADKAQKAGHTDQALEQLDLAIKADPASKEPWLRKAQIHFDSRQYGLAITESQEVLQRDVNDLTAKSILAVSGLRVSADALEQLRKVNEVNGPTRNEAESVARLIREALGEPILVQPVAGNASGAEPAKPRVAYKPAATRVAANAVRPPVSSQPSAPVAATSIRPTPTPPSNAGASASGRNNPFGALQ